MANCFGSIYNDTEWNKCVFSQIPEGSYCYECLCELAYKLSGQWVWTCKQKLSSSIVDYMKLIKSGKHLDRTLTILFSEMSGKKSFQFSLDAMFSLLTEVKEIEDPKEHFMEGPAVNRCGSCRCCIGINIKFILFITFRFLVE